MTFPRCEVCGGCLYDSSNEATGLEKQRSISCLMCGRLWWNAPPMRVKDGNRGEGRHPGQPRKREGAA